MSSRDGAHPFDPSLDRHAVEVVHQALRDLMRPDACSAEVAAETLRRRAAELGVPILQVAEAVVRRSETPPDGQALWNAKIERGRVIPKHLAE